MADWIAMHPPGLLEARLREFWKFLAGDRAYLDPYFVVLVSYSPKARIVRFRRVHESTIRRMSRLRFEKQARAA